MLLVLKTYILWPHLGVYNYEIGLPELGAEHTYGLEGSLGYMTDRGELKITSYQNYSPNYHLSKVMGEGYEPGADWIEWAAVQRVGCTYIR